MVYNIIRRVIKLGALLADVWQDLRSGVLLCELANKLSPGIVKKVAAAAAAAAASASAAAAAASAISCAAAAADAASAIYPV